MLFYSSLPKLNRQYKLVIKLFKQNKKERKKEENASSFTSIFAS